jgi:hypothetical protein
MNKKQVLLLLVLLLILHRLSAVDMIPESLILFERADTGYDLYIGKNEGTGSILLTESQKDPGKKKTNYGLRTERFHPANGNEIRILDKRVLHTRYDSFFLLDSTPEQHPILGECFHFFLPEELLYGYSWSRQGKVKVGNGTRINLRIFEKKYADYSGEFIDQWITLVLRDDPDRFRDGVVESITDLSDAVDGTVIVPDKPFNELIEEIPDTIDPAPAIDVVFIMDTTVSMKEEMPWFKKQFGSIRDRILDKTDTLRIGFIFYRDYAEMFLTKVYDLTDDMNRVEWLVSNIRIDGGDDIPEAMYEAFSELEAISFTAEKRYVYLFTDAPAHPVPRGLIDREDAVEAMKKSRIILHAYCLPFK